MLQLFKDPATGHNGVRVPFSLTELWQYDDAQLKWVRLQHVPEKVKAVPLAPANSAPASASISLDLEDVVPAHGIGLYYVKWTLAGTEGGTLVYGGRVQPTDIDIEHAPPGMIAVGVPAEDSARATFVPDPRIACRTDAPKPKRGDPE